VQPGDLIDLDVTAVAHGGVFVGRYGGGAPRGGGPGRVVFVPDAIPGETVRVRLTDTAKESFWRGDVLDVLTASPHRRPHVWRQAGLDTPPSDRPGGADFGHIDLAHQREVKRRVLVDAFARFAGTPLPDPDTDVRPAVDETADGTGWRTRVSLHVDADGRVGPYAARSHRVIDVADYPLSTPAVALSALQRARSGARAGTIELVQPSDGVVRVIPRPAGARAMPVSARETVVERVGAHTFEVDAGGFWQVHRTAATTLSGAVGDLLTDIGVDPDAQHLDLYGGVGLFAAALAGAGGGRVISVEADAAATERARRNLAEWSRARAESDRVDRWLPRWERGMSALQRRRLARGVVVLDPPRSGAGRAVSEGIAALQPRAIVYVACDPVALARDAKTLRAVGYQASALCAYDLFPNSHHFETIAVFRRD
jgi:tRNA/tmRNA/rRNA uracil-C5-methylase (TrmA/RlmC/RlmD family)